MSNYELCCTHRKSQIVCCRAIVESFVIFADVMYLKNQRSNNGFSENLPQDNKNRHRYKWRICCPSPKRLHSDPIVFLRLGWQKVPFLDATICVLQFLSYFLVSHGIWAHRFGGYGLRWRCGARPNSNVRVLLQAKQLNDGLRRLVWKRSRSGLLPLLCVSQTSDVCAFWVAISRRQRQSTRLATRMNTYKLSKIGDSLPPYQKDQPQIPEPHLCA